MVLPYAAFAALAWLASNAAASSVAPGGTASIAKHHSKSSDNSTQPDKRVHAPGTCAFGGGSETGSCGSKSYIPLPCAAPKPASPVTDSLRASIQAVCGPEYAASLTHACCTDGALEKLGGSLSQASAFIALCPACSDSFRDYYCHFTCSPDQSTFVDVTATQELSDGDVEKDGPAVKSLDFYVDPQFGKAFFDACKNVKFAVTNGYAMEFIGGNAEDWLSFLRYMGQERPGLGSPFQINFPDVQQNTSAVHDILYDHALPQGIVPLNLPALNCADSCACADCPERCLSLPPLPDTTSHCHVGKLTCGSFFLIIAYSILLLSFVLGIGIRDLWARRHTLFNSSALGGSGSSKQQGGRIHLPSSPGNYDRLDLADRIDDGDDDHAIRQLGSSDGTGMQRLDEGGRGVDPGSSRWRHRLTKFMKRSNSDPHRSEASSSSAFRSSNNSRHRGDSESNSQRLGRGASLLSPDVLAAYSQPRTYKLNNVLSSAFYKLGLACASAPYITICVGLVICGILNAGWAKFGIEKDPVRLWVAKDSELAVQKRVFEENFGPFYRTEQIFLSRNKPGNRHDPDASHAQPVLDWPTVQWWAGIEEEIRNIVSPAGTKLSEVCFAPTAESDDPMQRSAADCAVQSFMGYFKSSLDGITEENWAKELDYCAATPTACLSSSGQPLNPKLLFGGSTTAYQQSQSGVFTLDDVEGAEADFKASTSEAVVITYVVENSLDKAKVRKAAEWEHELKRYLTGLSQRAYSERGLYLSFSTEVSLEEELNKSTNTDVPIVVLSYLVMFFYVSLSLGGTGEGIALLVWALLLKVFYSLTNSLKGKRTAGPIALDQEDNGDNGSRSPHISISLALRMIFVDSKFTLGLVGIAIVLLSVSTSIGIFSFCGVRVTLIIAEVIPFLVLAIGVDNVFILAHELERQNARAYQSIRSYGSVQTGHLGGALPEDDDNFDDSDLPSAQERMARALGRMGPSILLSASCQTVAFGLGAVVGMPAVRNFAIYAAGAVAINAILQITVFVAVMTIDLKRIESSRVDCFPCAKLGSARDRTFGLRESIIVRFIRSVYAPFLLRKKVKFAVVALFSGLFVASWISTDYIQLGLDQRLALPRKSYLVDYFNDLDNYLEVGPPVYFVEQGLDVTHRPAQQAVCGRFSTCSDYSIGNLLEAERKRPESSYLAEPPSIWLDDFFQWLNPALSSCCRVKKRDTNTFCRPEESEFACKACYEDREPEWNITMEGLPEGEEFMRYLEHWLESPANEDCPLGGKAGYATAVSFEHTKGDDGVSRPSGVKASHFRTYHTPVKSQSDYINSLAAAKRISTELSQSTSGQVFPYSIFYVYFEQYATIVTTTRFVLALALAAVLFVTAIILGSWRTGFVVTLTVFMVAMNVLGIMGLWRISLNAISLVNLVISVGIGVEFCSHIARAFMGAGAGGGAGLPHSHPAGEKERDDRAYAALVDVGSSVFSGITLTKLIGISVLALTKSKLLEIYYFRMWLTLIISGALHGLVFLPVALSFQGGQGYSLFGAEEEEYIAEIARYRGRPFFAADEDDESLASDGGF